MKNILTLFLLLGFGTLQAQTNTQTFVQAAETAQEKLAAALDELDEIQSEINESKPAMGATLDEVEATAFDLRSKASNASRIKQGVDVEVSQLESERQNVIDINSYIQSTLVNEYFRRFDLTIDPSEISSYQETIRDTLRLLDSEEEIEDSTIFAAQMELLAISLDRLEKVIGGTRFEGVASVNGNIIDGQFLLMGPVSYFSGVNGQAGITNGMTNNKANIYELTNYVSNINSTVSAGSGILPIDTTDGEALEGITHDISLLEEFQLGGMVMYPILILFIIAILIATYRAIELARVKAADSKDIDIILSHLNSGNNADALSHAKSVGGPVGDMLCAAVENANEDREVIEEVLYESIIKTQPHLERYLAFIAVVAATAPLLGLLGTVTGMIKTFKLITIVGTGDAKNLSSGISEALITTKWGLIVAIPTLIMHALLNRKAKSVVGSMEQAAVGFINGLGNSESKAS